MRNISFIKNLPQITNVNEVCMYCKRFEKLENVIIHQKYFVLIWQLCVSLSKGRKLLVVDKNAMVSLSKGRKLHVVDKNPMVSLSKGRKLHVVDKNAMVSLSNGRKLHVVDKNYTWLIKTQYFLVFDSIFISI